MTMTELQFARKLMDQGVPLETSTVRRILEQAIELTVRQPPRHEGDCSWWTGAGCDCAEVLR